MTFVIESRPLTPEGRRHTPPPCGRARVHQGSRGDWGCSAWLQTEEEAVELAAMINAWFRKRQGAAGEGGTP